jgi:hypothetical protein
MGEVLYRKLETAANVLAWLGKDEEAYAVSLAAGLMRRKELWKIEDWRAFVEGAESES